MQGRKFVWAVGLYLLVGGAILIAQVNTGTVSGTVSDDSGAVVPGVEVIVKNVDTGTTRVVKTNDRGRYSAPQLSLGIYEVTAAAQGFQSEVRKGITLNVGQEAVVDFSLKVGAVSEKVEVTGEAPLVETTTATTSGFVSEMTVRELPLNGRSFTDLMDLQPNVKNLHAINAPQRAFGYGAEFSVSGSNPGENNYILDGLLINDSTVRTPSSAAGGLLGTDTIREFRMLTSNYSAEFGQVSGGIMTAVTKAGTNALHGSGFEFLRNSALDARSFLDPGGVKPFKRNQFGATIGGPVQKDKTFFFGSYEGLRQRLAVSQFLRVPTAETRRGSVPGGCPPAPVCTVQPVTQRILNLYPLPNANFRNDGTGDYISFPSNPTTENYFTVRLDHTISEKNFLFGRYTFDQGAASSIDKAGLFTNTNANRYQHAVLSLTSMLTASLLNSVTAGAVRSRQQGAFAARTSDVSALVFIPGRDPGNVAIAGLDGIGSDSLAPTFLWWTSYQVGDTLTFTHGNHSVKFGGALERNWDNRNRRFSFSGTYNFNSVPLFYAQSPQTLNTATPNADAARGLRDWLNAAFVQDDWKVLPNLTLNLGVRFEWATVPTEVNGKIATLPNILTDTTTTLGGPMFHVNSAFAHAAPRFGLAWDPFGDGKTSIRASAGIFQQAVRDNEFSNMSDRMPPFYQQTLLTANPTTPVLFPNAFANFGPGLPPIAARLDMVTSQFDQPYKATYGFSVQRQILPDTLLNVGYIGSRGIHLLLVTSDANQPASVLSPTGRRYIPLGTPRPNSNFTQIRYRDSGHDSYYNGLQIHLQKRFSHHFQISSSYTWSKSVDTSSLVVSQGTDFAGNADQEAYPFNTKANRGLSSWDLRHYWSTNYLYDLPIGPNRALLGGVKGAGGKLLEGWSVSGILSVNSGPPFSPALAVDYAAAQPQSGGGGQKPDLAPGVSSISSVLHGVTAGCSRIPAGQKVGTPDRFFDPCGFVLPPPTPQCAVSPLPSGCGSFPRLVFGNIGRSTLTGPRLFNFDISLLKSTKLREKSELQFRAEFFNVLNHANFGLPITNVFLANGAYDATSGQIKRMANNSRQIQFALKFIF